jgi:hypothetical protein
MDAATAGLSAKEIANRSYALSGSRNRFLGRTAMRIEGRLHGIAQTGQGEPPIRVLSIAPAVAAVDVFIRIQKEDHHRQIEIELKQIQVDAVQPRQSDAHKLVGDALEPFQTNNLLVEFNAVPSRDAAEDDHQRTIRLSRLPFGLAVVEDPAVHAGLGAVVAKAFFLRECSVRGQADQQ